MAIVGILSDLRTGHIVIPADCHDANDTTNYENISRSGMLPVTLWLFSWEGRGDDVSDGSLPRL